MKSRVYHSDKTEARHQLAQAPTGIRNELGCMQWQNSMTQLAACRQSNGRHFEHVL
jgi:hypothetical protein